MSITAAQRARVEKSLSKLVRLSNGRVVTTREFLDRLRVEGGVLKTFHEHLYAKEDEVAKKIEHAFRNVPFGNPHHPDTIAFEAEKARLKASLDKVHAGVVLPDGTFFELNKTELDYFTGLL